MQITNQDGSFRRKFLRVRAIMYYQKGSTKMSRTAILETWCKAHPKVEEWLDYTKSTATRYHYLETFHKFCEETNKTPEDLLKLTEQEAKDMIRRYYATNERADKKKLNTILQTTTVLRAFFALHFGHRLYFPQGTFSKPQIDTDSHDFSTKDLKAMFLIADVEEKAILTMTVSLGWEISALLDLDRVKIEALIAKAKEEKEETIFFEDIRHKSQEPRLGIINALAQEWVSKYLETSPKSDKVFTFTEQGLNKILKRLTKESGIQTTGRVHFHRLRAWHESALYGAGFNAQQVDFIQGHALGNVRRTYYKELQNQIMAKYPLVYHEHLDISNGNGNGEQTKKRVSALEEENTALKEELQKANEEIATLKGENEQNITRMFNAEKTLQDLMSLPTIKKELFNRKEKVEV
jgi:integrase